MLHEPRSQRGDPSGRPRRTFLRGATALALASAWLPWPPWLSWLATRTGGRLAPAVPVALADPLQNDATRERATASDTAALVPDWDIPGGHFYTQGVPEGAPADTGYVVSDEDGLAFWRDYQALGGPAQLGFPISSRYESGGLFYQVMQAAVLRGDATHGGADLFPIFDALAALGFDDWLEARGIPRTAEALLEQPDLPDEARLEWLTQPDLRAAYQGTGLQSAIARFGLPMSQPVRFGPYLAQRFDKAVLQLWLDDVPGLPAAGTISLVQTGNLLREAELIPQDALAPQPAPAPRPAPKPQPSPQPEAVLAPPSAGRSIVVSLSKQWWYAYQDGKLVYSGPVTTGQPELPTPIGHFSVMSRHSPYTFISPWPPGSKYWYPPSPTTFALQITSNGVFLHDAPWRPFYGPGTNVPHLDPDGVWRTGSHGCINMPYAAAAFLWSFAPIGTPVDVVP